ncbi:hypothetical protein F511_02692 [Dorcoceras hygrometricum]|uniref:Uncharacterized protein n=1 Tax=Dorcoceras hygrometricum TaxID=472368 RepID=A0A2Z7A2M9_9LAMI|nr:hypothetical protein F511_02692 [Dorcoceras hygrometricum]
MSSVKNPLAAILDSNKFTGLNYQDWLRNLNIVLASEKLLYTIEKSPPKEAPADISPGELVTLKQWWDDDLKTRCYVMASMSNEMQRLVEKLSGLETSIYDANSRPPLLSQSLRRRPPPPPPPLAGICSGQLFEEFPSVLISSGLLVQADEGTLLPVVDLIRRNLPPPTVKCRFPRETGRSQAPRRQQAHNSLQKGYRMKELLGRSPTLPQTPKTTVGNDGNSPEKLTVNSTRVRETEVDNLENFTKYGICINCFIMSSIKNPLDAILDSNKFTGLNYQDWLRNLNIVLASEKLLYTIEKSPPKETHADISPEELVTLQQCNKFTGLNYQDWLRNLNIVLASEKLLYTIEKSPPKETHADISPEELVTLQQWWDDDLQT